MKLYGELGWGSVIIEAQLAWYGFDYTLERVGDLFESADARKKLATINPIAQIPTLLMDDGTVMTESAAITLRLADLAGKASLVPAPEDPYRGKFLRWLVYLVANVYPTYTYADEPSRFVVAPEAREGFRETVHEYAKRLYGILEDNARAPWYLGKQFSALDIYVCAMTRWRPRRPWFAENTPQLTAIAMAAEALPRLKSTWEKNFPG